MQAVNLEPGVVNGVGEVVSKSVFAARLGVTKSAVSMWLKNGKLTGEALVGEGRTAQVRVDVALRQLRERVDPVLSLHKGLTLPLAAPEPAPVAAAAPPAPPVYPAGASALPLEPVPPANDAAARLQRLKVEQAERDAERDIERRLAEAGRYVDAVEARQAWTRSLSELVGETERWLLADVVQWLATAHGVDRAAVKAGLKQLWRQRRLAAASEATVVAAAVPAEIEADMPARAEAA